MRPMILVAEDDPDLQSLVRHCLEGDGYMVRVAGDGHEALELFRDLKPDLLILDVMMEEPDDGLRMARDLRRKGHTLPILMLTSVNQALGIHIGADPEIVPVDDFQEKPADPVALVQKVRKLLEGKAGASC